MLKNKILLFEEVAAKSYIKLHSALEEEVYLKIDPEAMDRIINKLLDNAVRYTLNGGEIGVELKTKKENVILVVADTGIGISGEQQEHICEPYYQIAHKKRNTQGIGLGLSIVKKIKKSPLC
jgi:two-component system sensor histidine kinase ChiS